MKNYLREQLEASTVIAQDDDKDYSESGWIAFKAEVGVYAIARYSHCSCYGTWSAIEQKNGNICEWQGGQEELIELARRCADPAMPDRNADPEDYDYDHLQAMYAGVLQHFGIKP